MAEVQVPLSLTDQFNKIKEQANSIYGKINTEGITDKSGKTLLSAGSLNDSQNITLPTVNPNALSTGSFNNIQTQGLSAFASATSQNEWLKAVQQQIQQNQENINKVTQTGKEQTAGMTDFLNNRTNTQDLINQQMEQWGVKENWDKIQALTPEIGALNTELANLDAKEMEETTRIEDNPQYSVQYASRESSRVSREYAIKKAGVSAELGAKTALMQAYQGNIETAKSMIKDVVDAMQYEDNLTLTSINTFMDNNQNFINTLNSNQQNLLNDVQSYWSTKTAQDNEDYTNKMNLVVEYGLNLSASAIKSMSYEEVASMAAKKKAEQSVGLGITIYDDELQSYLDGGSNASQAANLVVTNSTENLTQSEKQEILNRAIQLEKQKSNQEINTSEESVSTEKPLPDLTYNGQVIQSATKTSKTPTLYSGGTNANQNLIYNYLFSSGNNTKLTQPIK